MKEPNLIQEGGENSEQYQAGRDQVVNKNHYVIESTTTSPTNLLKALIEAYKTEANSPTPTSTGEFIEKLNFFMNTVDQDFRTLEEKLVAGGFSNDVPLALRLKHTYAMTLQKIKHISSAQKVHVYLLGLVMVNFSYAHQYLSKTENRPDNIFIKGIIDARVIAPVEQLIATTDNVLELYAHDIHSMMYYLTGNCHITWN